VLLYELGFIFCIVLIAMFCCVFSCAFRDSSWPLFFYDVIFYSVTSCMISRVCESDWCREYVDMLSGE